MSKEHECIYPASPRDLGFYAAIQQGYRKVAITDSTMAAALASAEDYFSKLAPDQLAVSGIPGAFISRPDFLAGVIEAAIFFGCEDASRERAEAFDVNPHYVDDRDAELEQLFLHEG